MNNAAITVLAGLIKVTAPTRFEAYSAALDYAAANPGDYAIEGPYAVGVYGGAIITGYGYDLRPVVSNV